MDLYERTVELELATNAGRACIWFVIRRRLLRGPDEERLIGGDPLSADRLAGRRVKAMCASARHRTGAEATVLVRDRMLECARWHYSTTEILTLAPGTIAMSMLEGFDSGAWD